MSEKVREIPSSWNKDSAYESLRAQLAAAEERARVAEEELREKAERDEHFSHESGRDVIETEKWQPVFFMRKYKAEVTRLTAQVKEWYDKWVQATEDLACESEELDTLRRNSVRVDVLLRWIYAINRKFRPTPVMVRMAELLGSRLTRRSLRKENGE